MNIKTKITTLLLAGILCSSGWLWLGGCDFTRVDEGASRSTETILAELSTADTPAKAETAIRHLLEKAEIGVQRRPGQERGLYDGYALSDDELAALAQAHANYVQHTLAQEAGARDVYDEVQKADDQLRRIDRVFKGTRTPILASLDEALAILHASTASALDDPEQPEHALLIALATDGATLPASAPAYQADQVLSPLQQLLFGFWLHKHGPAMFPFTEAEAAKAEATSKGGKTPCCGKEPSKFTSITLQYKGAAPAVIDVDVVVPRPKGVPDVFQGTVQPDQLFTVVGPPRHNHSNGFSYTIGNEIAINVDGSKNTQIHTSCSQIINPGDVFGLFQVVAITTKTGGICSDLEVCIGACEDRLATCMLMASTPEDEQACQEEYVACDADCHNQGSGSGN